MNGTVLLEVSSLTLMREGTHGARYQFHLLSSPYINVDSIVTFRFYSLLTSVIMLRTSLTASLIALNHTYALIYAHCTRFTPLNSKYL